MEKVYQQLEQRVLKLMDQYQFINTTNQDLYAENISLQNEKEHLVHQLQEAILYIENMLNQLKSLETST